MDDLSRALDEALLKDLECPVCLQYMVPPIKLCMNGHNICRKCRGKVTFCPTCEARFSQIGCLALEDIARRLNYPCANRQRGCLELFSIERIAKHNSVCVYGKIKCPSLPFTECSWNGLKKDVKEHAKAAHPKTFAEVSTFHDPYLSRSWAFVSCFGELFTYYKQIRNGRLCCAVRLVGTSTEASKYKCEFTLRAENGIEQISNTFLVRGYSEDFETIFSSRKCFILDEETAKIFVVDEMLNMSVTLFTL